MTPKEKAEQLVSNFYAINSKLITVKNGYDMGDRYNLVMPKAKNCALIAVDLAIEQSDFHIEFLQEVKQEIKLL